MTGMMLLAAAFRKESYGLGLVLAVVCGGILAVMLFDVFRKRICCTEAVLAEVTKVVSASAISGGGAAFRFAPEYQYDYNGQTYIRQSRTYMSGEQYYVGQRVLLRINPKKPTCFYDPKRDAKTNPFFIIPLIFFLIVGLVTM